MSTQASMDPDANRMDRRIAVIGIAGRFPQADDVEAFWKNLEQGRESVRRIDPETGEVLERLEMPAGTFVSGLESDGGERFLCGGGKSGRVRAVRRPR